MFDLTHILYMVITGLIGAALGIGFILLKSDRLYRVFIRFFAILTLVIQYSILWVDYFSTGEAKVHGDLLLPIYPCNICMWLLLFSAIFIDNKSLAVKLLHNFTFLATCICCAIGVIFNYNYAATPDLGNYYILKGLLTHSTTFYGALLLFLSGRVVLTVKRSLASVISGLTVFIIDGVFVNTVYALCGLPPVNAMYLLEPPFPAIPWFSTAMIGLLAIIVTLLISVPYELIMRRADKRTEPKAATCERGEEGAPEVTL